MRRGHAYAVGRGDLDFCRDDDGEVEVGESDGGTGVPSGVGSVEVDNEFGVGFIAVVVCG
jgi:hypothetical protein